MANNKPLVSVKAGTVTGAVWENSIESHGKTVTVLKATVNRRYKAKDGSWQNGNSFGRTEIPLVIYCLEKCFEKIVNEDSNNTEEMAG
jgi:hypothetical protein